MDADYERETRPPARSAVRAARRLGEQRKVPTTRWWRPRTRRSPTIPAGGRCQPARALRALQARRPSDALAGVGVHRQHRLDARVGRFGAGEERGVLRDEGCDRQPHARAAAVQWARKGVRVNALGPGWFPSEMTAEMVADSSSTEYMRHATAPRWQRYGDPAEARQCTLLFLATTARRLRHRSGAHRRRASWTALTKRGGDWRTSRVRVCSASFEPNSAARKSVAPGIWMRWAPSEHYLVPPSRRRPTTSAGPSAP